MMEWLNNNPSVLTLISVCVIFIGWQVIYKNSKRITDRNETHALLRAMIDKVDNLVHEGTTFWLDTKDDDAHNRAMTRRFINTINHIKLDIRILKKRKINPAILTEIVKIRSALTMDAESANKVSPSEAADKLDELMGATESLKEKFYDGFMTLHPTQE